MAYNAGMMNDTAPLLTHADRIAALAKSTKLAASAERMERRIAGAAGWTRTKRERVEPMLKARAAALRDRARALRLAALA